MYLFVCIVYVTICVCIIYNIYYVSCTQINCNLQKSIIIVLCVLNIVSVCVLVVVLGCVWWQHTVTLQLAGGRAVP